MSLKLYKNNGFGLLELSVVLIIIGLLYAVSFQLLTVYMSKRTADITTDNIMIVRQALEDFYALNGRYPCPADPVLAPDDANYGIEQCRADLTDPCPAVATTVRCLSGERDADNQGGLDRVLIGVLPFKTLKDGIFSTEFTSENAQDSHNMHFTYAVSELMADDTKTIANPANYHLGSIRVIDENDEDVLDPVSSAHYVLVSHGDNREGGYTLSGQRVSTCITGLVADPLLDDVAPPGMDSDTIATDKENCDFNDAIFSTGYRSLIDNSTYYDDTITYTSIGLQSHWARSLTSSDSAIYNTNLGNVGVGTDNPTEKLHITESLSSEGKVGAKLFCNSAGTKCLDANALAGTGSACTNPHHLAYGIEENKLLCREVLFPMPTATCGIDPVSGEQTYLVGFSNKGNIRCETKL